MPGGLVGATPFIDLFCKRSVAGVIRKFVSGGRWNRRRTTFPITLFVH